MDLSSILPKECVVHSNHENNADAALLSLLHLMLEKEYITDVDIVYQEIRKREETRTMLIHDNIWLPRIGSKGVKKTVAGVLRFESPVLLQDKEVKIIVLLLAPLPKSASFLKALTVLAKIVSSPDFGKNIMTTLSRNEIHEYFMTIASKLSF